MVLQEAVDLLRGPTDECAGVQQLVQLVPDRSEEFVLLNPLDQIVLSSFLLDDSSSLVREHSDLLVTFLSVSSLLDDRHDDVFGGHEGEFLANSSSDDGGVDNKTLRDVLKGGEDDIGR